MSAVEFMVMIGCIGVGLAIGLFVVALGVMVWDSGWWWRAWRWVWRKPTRVEPPDDEPHAMLARFYRSADDPTKPEG